jgi:hypothetical protein
LKSIFSVFVALFLAFALPKVLSLYNESCSDQLTTTFAGLSTAPGIYSANLTLPKPIFRNSLVAITDVSSNISSDIPSAYAYNTLSHLLTINGLQQNQTRTASVTYRIVSTTIEPFMVDVIGLFLWLYIFAVIGIWAGAVYSFFTN